MDPISIGASVVSGLFGFFKKRQADKAANETTQYINNATAQSAQTAKDATAAAGVRLIPGGSQTPVDQKLPQGDASSNDPVSQTQTTVTDPGSYQQITSNYQTTSPFAINPSQPMSAASGGFSGSSVFNIAPIPAPGSPDTSNTTIGGQPTIGDQPTYNGSGNWYDSSYGNGGVQGQTGGA